MHQAWCKFNNPFNILLVFQTHDCLEPGLPLYAHLSKRHPSSPCDLSQRRSIILFLPPLSPVCFRTNSEPSQKEHLSCLLSVFLELRLRQSQHLLHSESRNLWYFPMGLASKSSFSQFAPAPTRLSSWGQQQSSSAPVNMAGVAEAGGQASGWSRYGCRGHIKPVLGVTLAALLPTA